MSKEYIVGIDLTTREGLERRLDITPDWQVWVNDEERKKNLGPLSAVMLAGVISEIDSVVSSRNLYNSSYEEYKRFTALGAEPVSELAQEADLSLARIFNQHFRKIYMPVTSVCKGNVFTVTSLPRKNMFLLSRDMSDSDHVVSVIEGSDLSEENSSNNLTFQKLVLKQFTDRGYVEDDSDNTDKNDDYSFKKRKTKPSKSTTQRLDAGIVEVPTRATKARDNSTSEEKRARFNSVSEKYEAVDSGEKTTTEIRDKYQSEFTNWREYSSAMLEHIKEIGDTPFDVEDLEKWAKERGLNPNPGEIERRVLLAATNASLVKRTNVYITNKTVKEMWILLKK